ncbi:MAG TPA: DUF5317 family protein [Pilimelia sp.]|nr:DUF5317 family protein [Pilimelia sp.]
MAALVLAPLLGGVLGGYAFGGRLSRLIRTGIRAVWLLWLAAGLQLVHFEWRTARTVAEAALGTSLLAPIFGLVGAWLVVNMVRRPRAVQAAAALILVGGGMNAAAIAVNGRMPFAESAVLSVQPPADRQAGARESPKHVAADADTRLWWLGDVIPVAPIRKVVSAGDLVLLAGVAALIAAAMREPAGRRPTRRPGGHGAKPGCRCPGGVRRPG